MDEQRVKELLTSLMGAISERFQFDMLFELCDRAGFTEKEMAELGWMDED